MRARDRTREGEEASKRERERKRERKREMKRGKEGLSGDKGRAKNTRTRANLITILYFRRHL